MRKSMTMDAILDALQNRFGFIDVKMCAKRCSVFASTDTEWACTSCSVKGVSKAAQVAECGLRLLEDWDSYKKQRKHAECAK